MPPLVAVRLARAVRVRKEGGLFVHYDGLNEDLRWSDCRILGLPMVQELCECGQAANLFQFPLDGFKKINLQTGDGCPSHIQGDEKSCQAAMRGC